MESITDVSGRVWSPPGPLEGAALLVVDIQRDFADPDLLTWLGERDRNRVAAAVERASVLVARARAVGVRVVWVGLGQDPAEPWSTSRWLRGLPDAPADDPAGASGGGPDSAVAEQEPCVTGTPGAEWFGVAPGPGEDVIAKRRYSGFLGTGLERTLRESGTTWVVAAGLTTECCVDATVRDAFQLGFRTVVASDATAAYQEDAHRYALESLAQNAAVVAATDAVTAAWDAAARLVGEAVA